MPKLSLMDNLSEHGRGFKLFLFMENLIYENPKELREAIRSGRFARPTSGQAPGYLQCKYVPFPFYGIQLSFPSLERT